MFILNSTIENDSLPLMETELCVIRLANDSRYPWVIVVPKVIDAVELHDLTETQFQDVMATIRSIGEAMKSGFDADKINTAAIGNMVSQLHIHIVARFRDDPNWPGPVWGAGAMVALPEDEIASRTAIIRDSFIGS